MSAFAYIGQEDKLRRMVEVFVGEDLGDGTYKIQADYGTRIISQTPYTKEPTLRLTNAEAKALLEALLVHFGGSEGARQLRKDLDAERARLDKLLDRLPIVIER